MSEGASNCDKVIGTKERAYLEWGYCMVPIDSEVVASGCKRKRDLSAGVVEVSIVHQVDAHHLLDLDAARHDVLHHVGKELGDVFALGEHRQQQLHALDLVCFLLRKG